MKRWLAIMLCAAGSAQADTCSATLNNVSFGSVSPITGSDIYASATGTISCTWTLFSPTFPFLLLFPNAVVCVNLGTGSNSSGTTPRTLGTILQYNLYRDTSYAAASIFGGPGTPSTPTPLTTVLTTTNLVTGGTINQSFTVYGKIPAGASLASVPTSGNNSTVYSSSFTGYATINYAFYNLVQPACTTGGSSSFTFQASATVINDCTIAATPVNFGSTGILNGPKRATGSLSVRCTKNNDYQITLNGGSVANNVAARRMKPASGTERISYNLSQTLDGAIWGDGSGASTKYSGTGTGAATSVTIYGMVPAQTTPTPGDYQDTVTATVIF
ncbi:Csu type fimbrial protein [Pseudoduganella violaceinigra]|uniref:Csu type fimbrial protein n=1 Tax=Pseudoduganella violaceinigra TaxID=246602 RepID=UPI0004249F31|nr:spore coat U domain-containing protein [Pseudoduganella violaceinigra]